jgi:hypothetical protein
MDTLHHKSIKSFSLDGTIHDDASIGRLRIEYDKLIKTEMRLAGYVPRLDIDTDFTIRYNEKTEYFEFKITMYGTYVGKRKSEWIQGLDGTLVVPIQKNKSSEFLQEQGSLSREK